MSPSSIVVGGRQAFHLPRSLVYQLPATPLDGRSCKILNWILWEAHACNRWPNQDDEPSAIEVRYHARDMLHGAGLVSENGYAGLRASLAQIRDLRYHDSPYPVVAEVTERPGPHFDLVLASQLAAANWRPLAQYALLNMNHIRALRQPLDMAIYARACHVARARSPRFELCLDEIAWISGTRRELSWRTLRRQVLTSFGRVCAATGACFHLQAWCGGDYPGADRLMCHVGTYPAQIHPRFAPKPGALFFKVGPTGVLQPEASQKARRQDCTQISAER